MRCGQYTGIILHLHPDVLTVTRVSTDLRVLNILVCVELALLIFFNKIPMLFFGYFNRDEIVKW